MMKCFMISFAVLSFMSILSCDRSSQNTKIQVVNINIWESEDQTFIPYIDSIITEFEKKNPMVKVSRSHYSVDEIHTQFQSASIAGTPPDLILTSSDKTGLFISNGLLMPVTGHFDLAQYVDNAVDAVIQDGKTWGVPNNYGNQLMLYYNTDYVKKAPRTTNELLKICEKLIKKKNKKEQNKNITCLEFDQNEPFWLIPFLTSFGGWPIDGHTPNLDTEAMVKTFDFIKMLKKKNYISDQCEYNCMDSAFKNSQTAMIINGDWSASSYLNGMKDKVKISVLPVNSGTGIRMRPMVSGKYFFISSFIKPENLKHVKKFINSINSIENQKRMKSELKKLPAIRAVFEGPHIKTDPLFSIMAKQIEYGEAMPSVVEMRAIWDVIKQYQILVLSDKIDSVVAAKRMQQDVLKKINEMRI